MTNNQGLRDHLATKIAAMKERAADFDKVARVERMLILYPAGRMKETPQIKLHRDFDPNEQDQ